MGELLQQWSVVVMVQIHHPRIRNATTLHDVRYHPKSDVSQAVVDHMEWTNGKGYLVIFVGYDELADKQLSMNGIFMKLLKGDELPAATLMITS